MGEHGPDFEALFRRRGEPQYVAFDLLWLNGRDLRTWPLRRRKAALQRALGGGSIGYVFDTPDSDLLKSVVQQDLEGIVAKKTRASYSAATEWFKVKNPTYSQREGRYELFERRARA